MSQLSNPLCNSNVNAQLVSVIIPAYNAAPFIAETLDSVFAQTYRNFEIIVVNDGSPDTSRLEEVLAPYRERITYIRQENRGPNGARNSGLGAARGELIALLDADDIWSPSYLEEQTRFLGAHPEYDLVYCNALFFGESKYDGKEYMTVCPSEGEATAVALILRRCHVFVSVTARKRALAAVGFDESLRYSEDFDCWLRLTASGHRIGYHRKVLVRYRKHPTSQSADPSLMAESNLKVLTKALALWPPDSEEARSLLRMKAQKSAELETLKGKRALDQRETSVAIGHFQTANLYYKSAKISAVIFALKAAPLLVSSAVRLRTMVSRSYRSS